MIEKVFLFGLEKSDYCLLGSGHLEAIGLVTAHDLDVMVTTSVFESLKKRFNLEETISEMGSRRLYYDDVEFFTTDGFGKTSEEYIEKSVEIAGVMVASVEDVIGWKLKMGREKDFKHIKMLENYYRSQEANMRTFEEIKKSIENRIDDTVSRGERLKEDDAAIAELLKEASAHPITQGKKK